MRLHVGFGFIDDEVESPPQPQIAPKGGFVYFWKINKYPCKTILLKQGSVHKYGLILELV